jgi:hypothetical protein
MDATSYVGDRRTDASVRLSRDQKRDIASMVVASVITAGLIVAPAIAPRDQAVALLTSRSVPTLTSAPFIVDSRLEPPVVVTTTSSARPSRSRRTTSGIAPALYHSSASPVTPAVLTVRARQQDPVVVTARLESSRRPLARRLAGFLTGDGTHPIRPFPTVSSERQ